jgi:hypothetical protein
LKVFENRVLRRIPGPNRNKTGSWRTLHIEELHNLYFSLNIMFNFFVVVVVVVVLSLYLLSYLLCIHCGRLSFIVVFCVLCLIE